MLFIFAVCTALYIFLALLLLYGLYGGMGVRERGEARATVLPFISVIIPARNEAASIGNLLQSLAAQDYTRDNFEVIVVDDRSTDNTGDIARAQAGNFAFFSVISIEEEAAGLFGKQNAIDAGVRVARGDCIVQTDADCDLDSGFLRAYAEAFGQGASFVFSWTVLEPVSTAFERLQASDLAFLFSVAAGTAKLGVPLSCMGNNVGYTKGGYLSLGGYPALGPSPVEDYQLLSAFRKKGFAIRYLGTPEPLVRTSPVPGLKAFLYQRVRWARGAALVNPGINLLTLVVLLTNTLSLYCIIGLLWGSSWAGAALALTKIAVDGLFFAMGSRFFKQAARIGDFLVWELYFLASPVVYLVLMIFLSRRKWR